MKQLESIEHDLSLHTELSQRNDDRIHNMEESIENGVSKSPGSTNHIDDAVSGDLMDKMRALAKHVNNIEAANDKKFNGLHADIHSVAKNMEYIEQDLKDSNQMIERNEDRIHFMENSLKHFDKGQYQIHPPTPPPTNDMAQNANDGKMIKPVSWSMPLEFTWDDELKYSEPIPRYYKEHHQWDIGLVSAPDCPDNTSIIRLIKTAPFNFAFRTESTKFPISISDLNKFF